MGQDGKPIQISSSDLQSGATLTGIYYFHLIKAPKAKLPGIVKKLNGNHKNNHFLRSSYLRFVRRNGNHHWF